MHFSITEQTESLYWETGISFCVEQVLRDLRGRAGVVKTGMRAMEGAVDRVKLKTGNALPCDR